MDSIHLVRCLLAGDLLKAKGSKRLQEENTSFFCFFFCSQFNSEEKEEHDSASRKDKVDEVVHRVSCLHAVRGIMESYFSSYLKKDIADEVTHRVICLVADELHIVTHLPWES